MGDLLLVVFLQLVLYGCAGGALYGTLCWIERVIERARRRAKVVAMFVAEGLSPRDAKMIMRRAIGGTSRAELDVLYRAARAKGN